MVFSAWMKASGGGFCLRAHVFLFWKFADEFSTFTSWTWWNLSPNHLLDFSLWTDTMSPLKGITDRLTFSNTPIISTPCIIRLHYFLWKECSSSLSTKKKKKLSPFSSKAAASIKLHMSYLKKKKNWDIFDTDIMPMDRGAWRQFCPWSCRESDMTEWLTQQQNARVDLRHLHTWSLQRQLATLSCCVVIASFSAVEMIKFDSDAMTRALFATLCTGSLELIYYSLQVGTLKQHPSHRPAFKPMSTPFYSLFLWVLFF